MASRYLLSLLILYLLSISSASGESEIRSTYIIHLAPSLSQTHTRTHPPLHSLLPSHLRHPSPSHLYTYNLATYGYAALLTPSQAHYLESHSSILSIQPDHVRYPHITHTPSFLKLSLSDGLWLQSNLAEETIVAVLDTGIWPERPCFACDNSFPPPPSKWKGGCVSTTSFNASQFCSNKLIGAKYFAKGYEAAIGHPIDETRESRLALEHLISFIIISAKMKSELVWCNCTRY
jgi:Peptidase inhibitor I9